MMYVVEDYYKDMLCMVFMVIRIYNVCVYCYKEILYGVWGIDRCKDIQCIVYVV